MASAVVVAFEYCDQGGSKVAAAAAAASVPMMIASGLDGG